MSVDYYYFNRDKSQFFPSGLFFYCGRFKSAGLGLGGRALAILLSESGTWRNDRISLVADTDAEFDTIAFDMVNIEVEVSLMLLDVDGTEWAKDALDNSLMFSEMCAIAQLLRRQDVIAMLDEKFGTGIWQRQYQEYLKRNSDFDGRKINAALKRGLCVLTKPARAG